MQDRIIFHVDMNAFFASVEQMDHPELVGKPVAVVPGKGDYKGSAILARSYEAKAYGVKSFWRVGDALRVCPQLKVVGARYDRYYEVHQLLEKIMADYSQQMEVYSIDEFFLDLTDYFKFNKKSPAELAFEIKQRIADEVHSTLKCSIGVGCNKLLAKVGSDFQKPDGLTIIDWEKRFWYLDQLYIGDVWGIGFRSTAKLTKMGIKSTSQIRNMDRGSLERLVGSYWLRLQQIANGEDHSRVHEYGFFKPAKTMQHAHTLAHSTKDLDEVKFWARKLSEKLAKRLRKHGQQAIFVNFGIRPAKQKNYGWGYLPGFFEQINLDHYTDDGYEIYKAAINILQKFDLSKVEVRLLVVGVGGLVTNEQIRIFDFRRPEKVKVDKAIDKINQKYGSYTVRPADLIKQRAEKKASDKHSYMRFHPDN